MGSLFGAYEGIQRMMRSFVFILFGIVLSAALVDADLCGTRNGGCLNGAACININATTVSCECTSGWEGTLCDQNINECNTQNKGGCVNGICKDTPGSFYCRCNSGYKGAFCDIDIN